jgi:hypothetical protein
MLGQHKMVDETLKNAVYQNLNEVAEALYYMSALVGMAEAKSENKLLFLRVASDALKNDMVSHLMRVLDRTNKTASFWYIYKKEKDAIDKVAKEESINFSLLEELSTKDRLYHIRNKTHFHLDKNYTYNQCDSWKEANISSQEMKNALESLLLILSSLFKKYSGIEFSGIDYNGTDAAAIVDVANKHIKIE